MSKAALLFNGLKLPFPVIDRAFDWSKQSNGSLVAVFLKARKEPSEGYLFPGDLDAAENLSDNKDAQVSMETIIDSNIRMLKHRAAGDKIEIRTVLLTNPTEEFLREEIGGCERIFASDKITQTGAMTTDSVNLEKWLSNPPVTIEIIGE